MIVSLLNILALVLLPFLLVPGCSSESQQIDKDVAAKIDGASISKTSEDAAAIVNGVPIPKSEMQSSVDNTMNRYKSFGMELDSTKVDSLRNQILDYMIRTELMYQESQQAGFVVSDSALASEIETVKNQYPNEETFKSAMDQQGITEEQFRTHMLRTTAIKNYITEKITNQIEVTTESKSEYYEKHKEEFKHSEEVGAKHILIQTSKSDPPDSLDSKKAKIDELLTRIKNGEDFSTLATEHSDCPSSAKGGDLGYFSRGKMVQSFEEAAFSMNIGDVSEVIETNYGYHIIQVYGKKEAGQSSFEEMEEYIEDALKKGKTNEELEKLFKELEEKAEIDRML
jgi:peptidyl-prolyl cis-trans isomerase C